MEPPSKSPEAAPETPKRRWRSGIWISAFGIFLLGLGWFSVRAFNLKIPGLS